jgi:RecA/RadA recombinase
MDDAPAAVEVAADEEEEATPEAVPEVPAPRVRSKFDHGGNPAAGRARIFELAEQLGKAWGYTAALPLSVAPMADFQRLPTGILQLDWKTGGGFVVGRLNRLWGPKGSLKTTTLLSGAVVAQHTCRHCKCPLVRDPETGDFDCRCPNPRWWIADDRDYTWLPVAAAISLCLGRLPEGAVVKQVKGVGRVPVLKCNPPLGARDGSKAREIAFRETDRNEPMRGLYLDAENRLNRKWAKTLGVDPDLILMVSCRFGEQSLSTVEQAIRTRAFDYVAIDSTTALETKANLEKALGERKVVAAKQSMMADVSRRFISQACEEGVLGRYSPTIVTASQVSTKGIGGPTPAWLGPTDGNAFEHALCLDIQLREAGYIYNAERTHAVIGKFDFTVKKNTASGGVMTKGQIRFRLRGTHDKAIGDAEDLATVMQYARSMGDGFISEGKTGLTIHSRYVRDGSLRFTKVGACVSFLRENPTVYGDLRERVLSALMEKEASLVAAADEASTGEEGPAAEEGEA